MAPHIDMPMNTANHHGANAEDYYARGLYVLAAEEHEKAADALLAAIERSNDESAKRTLRMLHNKHLKDRDDLQRRIQKLRDEGKDPNLPQVPQRQTHAAPSHLHPTITSSVQNQSRTSSQQRPMSDSHNTVDESFMVLGGQRSEPGDAFNQFWNVLQGMLDNIPQPVAFATAPLGDLDIPAEPARPETPPPVHVYGGISGKERREPVVLAPEGNYISKWTKKIPGLGSIRGSPSTSSSFQGDDIDGDFFEDGDDDLSGSFCVVPSGEPTNLVLRKENSNLQAELIVMQDKLKAAEHLLKLRREQDAHLRTSIFEAQRAISASGMLPPRQTGADMSVLNFAKPPAPVSAPAVPIPAIKAGREAQYTKRIKELEDELRAVRSENEKNKLMIVKFRERWEKLKESAKRKKEAKASSEGVRNQKIVEEPEAEEELDGTNG